MPIYEYHCAACDRTFEQWQKISEPPVKKCPECGAKKVSRLISQTSFHLKGSGWYVTDYGKGGVKPESASSESKSGGESKPAAASETKSETAEVKPGKAEKAKASSSAKKKASSK